MLGTLQPDQKRDWKKYVGALTHAYNSTKHDSTGYTPFYLMFGRHPRLAIDILLGAKEQQKKGQEYTEFVTGLRQRLDYAYDLAASKVAKAQEHQRKYYDLKTRGAAVDVGDRVLVRSVNLRGKHKLADRWEEDTYIVTGRPNPDIPVFEVKREDGKGRTRVLHRNLLLPISAMPAAEELETRQKPEERKRKGKSVPTEDKPAQKEDADEEADRSGNEEFDEETEDSYVEEVVVLAPAPEQRPVTPPTQPREAARSLMPVYRGSPHNPSPARQEGEGRVVDENPVDGRLEDFEEEQGDGEPDEQEAADTSDEEEPAPRRTKRERRPPAWMDPTAYQFQQQPVKMDKTTRTAQRVEVLKGLLNVLLQD